MRILLLIAILAVHSPLAFSKCGSKTFVLSGVVVQPDNRPAAGVLVGVAWKEDGLIGGPALAKSDSEGRYSIPIIFHTYSSTPGKSWYECKGQLKEVRVSAYSDIHYAPPIVVQVSEGASLIEASPLNLSFDISTGVPIEYGG
jgi:hypothetical protein